MASIKTGGQTFNVGQAASAKEIAQIAKSTGLSVAQVTNRIEKAGIDVEPAAAAPAPAPAPAAPAPAPKPAASNPIPLYQNIFSSAPPAGSPQPGPTAGRYTFPSDIPNYQPTPTPTPGPTQPIFTPLTTQPPPAPPIRTGELTPIGLNAEQAADVQHQNLLAEIKTRSQKELDSLAALSNERLENIRAGVTRFGYEADERAKKYVADRQAESGLAIEKIRGDKNIDLQKIINTGLENVSKTETAGRSDVARITGEFGVKQEKVRQGGQQETQRIASRGNIYNSIISAFSF
jgi:hypothetical protein